LRNQPSQTGEAICNYPSAHASILDFLNRTQDPRIQSGLTAQEGHFPRTPRSARVDQKRQKIAIEVAARLKPLTHKTMTAAQATAIGQIYVDCRSDQATSPL